MRAPLLALAFGFLVACGGKPQPVPGAPESAPSTTANAPAPSDAELKQAAAATQEGAGTTEAAGDASLERIAAMPENAQLPGGRWKAGTHYIPLVPAQGTSAEPGQVEVIEVLWLGCPHCYEMQPFIDAWKKKKAPYIKFVQEHVMWGPTHRNHGRLFYTLEALKREDLVSKAFDQIHRQGNVLVANNDADSQKLQVAFAKANGISEADFKRESTGFAVNTRLQRAEELTRRLRVESVPTFYVNGKYQTDVGMAGGPEQLTQLLSDLAAAEKR